MKVYFLLTLMLLPILLTAVGISFTLANSSITSEGGSGYYEFDVIATADELKPLEAVQVYLNYSNIAFGTLVHNSNPSLSHIVVTKPNTIINDGYALIVNNNTTSKVSLALNYSEGTRLQLFTTPETMFHVKMTIASSSASAGISFDNSLMQGQQYYRQALNTYIQYNPVNTGAPLDETLPVELSSFTANITNQNYVSLNWITQSETGVVGFSIYRSQEDNLESAALISPMITATNTSQMQSYVYVDEEIFEDGTYYYWLENADLDGTRDYHGPTTIQYTSMNNNGTPSMIPVTGINSVYPNPFNPSTCIKYGLKDSGKVDITIYNSRGQKIRNLLSQTMDAGVYRLFWNGLDDTNQICTSGVYIVRMTTPTRSYSSRIILLK